MAQIEYNQGIESEMRIKTKLIHEHINKEKRTCIVYWRACIGFGTVHMGLCTLYMP